MSAPPDQKLEDSTKADPLPSYAEADMSASKTIDSPESKEPPPSFSWPELDSANPLALFAQLLPEILEKVDYNEVYGIILDAAAPFQTKLILQKFLRANANDLTKARQQLEATLKWRKEFRPLEAKKEVFSKNLFGGLGYVITVKGVPGDENRSNVITFNLYGAVKDLTATFGDTDRYAGVICSFSSQHLVYWPYCSKR